MYYFDWTILYGVDILLIHSFNNANYWIPSIWCNSLNNWIYGACESEPTGWERYRCNETVTGDVPFTEVDARVCKLTSCFEVLRRKKCFPFSSYRNYYLEQDQSAALVPILALVFGRGTWRRGSKWRDWRRSWEAPGFGWRTPRRCSSESVARDHKLAGDRTRCRGSSISRTLWM